ncbi:hypothetical protein MtrunA17_Chr4g0022341 [Medicago truncatula]|uniref:Uncharacterized protein n=1 Tax=Medicago truncatula TaxID=3880 RepID=A0A396I3D1_MEDTR|nr:hypothetical protein MtrunA17_Chr4g0022341 [Medicago truncatula]
MRPASVIILFSSGHFKNQHAITVYIRLRRNCTKSSTKYFR